ncbi:MAG TPA: putative lipid II flippase FtsW [Kiritimatiellia bacterium]|mgnify:CR=1 FL=1|jgi:cell division protein FtsW|nr:MAG: Lipid II flippase FtsW [Verrucomicrobia bacterium ADurb.Bin070]HPO38319.1 putative lipid II flippase FtsW [Kiritimatiellia bacterium]HQA37483.1 putative lipid II flippase FtsW [Kiritimatiellia bacterium]HQL50258.1 putative lipid II flippase FtsW [Kiritimatiellia bacterium]HQQ91118.1 putative lipid II flippase FtsW [Kiritimatiellia bacterium]
MRKTLTTLALTVVALLGLGIVLLATASAVRAQGLYADPHFFVRRQLMWLGVSFVVVFAATRFDYHWWKETPALSVGFYLMVVTALLLVFVPVIGSKVKGSYRWLNLGPLRMQPSEFAKVLTVVAMSVWMDRIGRCVRQFWKGAVFPAFGLVVIAGLLVMEPDFGATMVVCVAGGALMFVAGTRIIYLLFFGVAGVSVVGAFVLANANRMERITAWLHGEESGSSAAYQLKQALLAFENGGPWGVGFNQSIQKYNYLPEAHTDFIYAIGGEEFGFIFSISVIAAYVVILVCGMLISLRAPDRLGRFLAFGMTLLLVFQAAFNIGVVTGCLPTKGLALPFMSYGGTNLVTAMLAIGTLMNIGRHVDVFDERLHTQVVKNATIKL